MDVYITLQEPRPSCPSFKSGARLVVQTMVSHGYKLFQLAGLKGPRECFSPSPLRVYPGVSIMSIYASVKSYQRRSKDLSAVSQGNGMVSDHGTLRNEL